MKLLFLLLPLSLPLNLRGNHNFVKATPIFEGFRDTVWELMKTVYLDPVNEHELLVSAKYNQWERVLHILEDGRLSPSIDQNFLLERAAAHGGVDLIDYILSHPKLDLSEEIQAKRPIIATAVRFNNRAAIFRLLDDPRIDPSVNNNEALKEARLLRKFDAGYQEIVDRLLGDPRVQAKVLVSWKDKGTAPPSSAAILNNIPRLTVKDPVEEPEGFIKRLEKKRGSKLAINTKQKKFVIPKYNPECVICLEEYTYGASISQLPCLHHAHTECMEDWLKRQSVCPVCKRRVGLYSEFRGI